MLPTRACASILFFNGLRAAALLIVGNDSAVVERIPSAPAAAATDRPCSIAAPILLIATPDHSGGNGNGNWWRSIDVSRAPQQKRWQRICVSIGTTLESIRAPLRKRTAASDGNLFSRPCVGRLRAKARPMGRSLFTKPDLAFSCGGRVIRVCFGRASRISRAFAGRRQIVVTAQRKVRRLLTRKTYEDWPFVGGSRTVCRVSSSVEESSAQWAKKRSFGEFFRRPIWASLETTWALGAAFGGSLCRAPDLPLIQKPNSSQCLAITVIVQSGNGVAGECGG